MFSGWSNKLKSTFGLDEKDAKVDAPVVEKLPTAAEAEQPQAEEEPPSDFTPILSLADQDDDEEKVPIPGASLVDHIEQRQQLLAARRRQIVSMATKADQTMGQAANECRQHLDFVSVVDQELKQLPHISATVMGIRTSLEKLLSDCHELELAFSEVSEAKVLLGLERWRDEQWDMMARFREAKKQEIKALERKVQAKKDKVKQVQEQQQKQTMKHDARGGESADKSEGPASPLPPMVAAMVEEGAHQAAAVILEKEMKADTDNLDEDMASGSPGNDLGDQLTSFVEKQGVASNEETQAAAPEASASESGEEKKGKKKKKANRA